jgi:hypothetical protein
VSLNDNKTFNESLYYATDYNLMPINGYFSQDTISLAQNSTVNNVTFVEALRINGQGSSTASFDVCHI